MTLLTKRRVLAAKVETTLGTAIALDANAAAFNVYDMQFTENIEMNERQKQGSFQRLKSVPGGHTGQVTFKTELHGDGAGGEPLWASTFLPACGWGAAGSGIYTPVAEPPSTTSGKPKTLTMGGYQDGKLKKLVGCMGTWRMILTAGMPAMMEWTFTGKWAAVADATLLAPTYPSVLPFRFANTAVTNGFTTGPLQELTFDAGNNVVMREDPTASDGSGYLHAIVTDRQVKGTMNPEAVLVATDDPYADLLASNQGALAVTFDDGTDVLAIGSASNTNQIVSINDADRNGIEADEIEFQVNGDDFVFTFVASSP